MVVGLEQAVAALAGYSGRMDQKGWIVLLSAITCIGAMAVYARLLTAKPPSPWDARPAMKVPAQGADGFVEDRSATMRTPVPDDWLQPDGRKRLSFLHADGTPAAGLAVVVGGPASPQLYAMTQSGLPRRILADSDGDVLLDADLDPGEALTVVLSEWVVLQGKLADWCRTPRIVLPQLAGLTVWIAPRLSNSELRLCRLRIERVGGEVEVPTIPGVRVQTATRTLPVPDIQELRVSGLLADFEYEVGIECPERLVGNCSPTRTGIAVMGPERSSAATVKPGGSPRTPTIRGRCITSCTPAHCRWCPAPLRTCRRRWSLSSPVASFACGGRGWTSPSGM